MISTHILDTTLGMPAKNVKVVLEKREGLAWVTLFKEITNNDGRIAFNTSYEKGDYRLIFETGEYLKSTNAESFFIDPVVTFRVNDINRKYHVPLVLNPYAYSTYRGS